MNPGTSLGPYELLAPLGAGGMGEVWRARDPRLGREVALKILPPAFAEDRERLNRFEQEAKALAALSHPHVLAIYDVGSQDGTPFLVTELLEGTTLRERLSEGPLPLPEALMLATQMAKGLAAAHARGIVHRDLKPENVFLTGSGVKLLDFGLARQAPAVLARPGSQGATLDLPQATTEGTLLGTLGYMSPEQVRGETVDARSDLFALGVVLWEGLAGRPTFTGATAADTLAAVLKEEPPDLGHMAPPALQALLRRCLKKRREDRFPSAQDLLAALQAVDVNAEVETSIVVLPFENLSPDPDNAYFADGLTEELIADLSKVQALRVISRTSAMHFKGTDKALPEIAQALKVRYVLEGSVRRAGNSLRITAQLIEADTDTHLWAEKYTGTFDDVFDLQEKLSRRIVEALKGFLSPEDASRLAHHGTRDPRVYELWMRAHQECWRMDAEGVERALRMVEQGLHALGDHPLLHAALGVFSWADFEFGYHAGPEVLARGDAAAVRALELDPGLAQAWLAKGLIAYKRGDLATSLQCLRRALDLERASDTLGFLAIFLSAIGQPEEARRCADEAIERDPVAWNTHFMRFYVDFSDGRFAEALTRWPRWAGFDMGVPAFAQWWRGQTLAFLGREAEAGEVFAEGAGAGVGQFADLCRFWTLALQGDPRKALDWFHRATELHEAAEHDEIYPFSVATCLARLGRFDLCLQWLEKAIRWGFTSPRFHGELNPFLAPLRGDPRFQELLSLARSETLRITRA